jgi:chorismate lyase/3-hydroxybenzoate synthase
MTSALSPYLQDDESLVDGRTDRALPRWLNELTGARPDAAPTTLSIDSLQLSAVDAGDYAIIRVCVPNAVAMRADDFEAATVRAYDSIFEQLSARSAKHPLRLWNYLPSIHQPLGGDRDRYMVFNAGRFKSFEKWYGGRDRFDGCVATASGVGHTQSDLWIDCLACETPGLPVDNPRQIKPYCYSTRFGPLPPCFARSTIARPKSSTPLLLVGGTASIRGEDSVHLQDLSKQTQETFENLAALVRAACERIGMNIADEEPSAMFDRYRDLRVYHPDARHADFLRSAVLSAFPNLQQLEMRQANLCRAELLVEIEGLADLR